MIGSAAFALRGMGGVMVVLIFFAARPRELGERATAMAAGDLADEGAGTELAGRPHARLHSMAPPRRQSPFRIASPGRPRYIALVSPVLLLAALLAPPAVAAAPAPPPVATTTPAPVTDWPFNLFTEDDYPSDALRGDEQGRVGYHLEIGADGRVSDCTIRRSSGSAALDERTCRIVRVRARFAPARDSEGRAVPDARDGEVSWRLPSYGGD